MENLGKPNFYRLCSGNPDTGYRNKYCSLHHNVDSGNLTKAGTVPIQQDLRPVTRSYAKKLVDQNALVTPTDDEIDNGCRNTSKYKKFYETTAGIILIVRPCGIRLGTYDCYTKVETFLGLVV